MQSPLSDRQEPSLSDRRWPSSGDRQVQSSSEDGEIVLRRECDSSPRMQRRGCRDMSHMQITFTDEGRDVKIEGKIYRGIVVTFQDDKQEIISCVVARLVYIGSHNEISFFVTRTNYLPVGMRLIHHALAGKASLKFVTIAEPVGAGPTILHNWNYFPIADVWGSSMKALGREMRVYDLCWIRGRYNIIERTASNTSRVFNEIATYIKSAAAAIGSE